MLKIGVYTKHFYHIKQLANDLIVEVKKIYLV